MSEKLARDVKDVFLTVNKYHGYKMKYLDEDFMANSYDIIVISKDEIVIGFAAILINPYFMQCMLHHLMILPEYQKMGIGKSIIPLIESMCIEKSPQNHKIVKIDVVATYYSLGFWEKMGYICNETTNVYAPDIGLSKRVDRNGNVLDTVGDISKYNMTYMCTHWFPSLIQLLSWKEGIDRNIIPQECMNTMNSDKGQEQGKRYICEVAKLFKVDHPYYNKYKDVNLDKCFTQSLKYIRTKIIK